MKKAWEERRLRQLLDCKKTRDELSISYHKTPHQTCGSLQADPCHSQTWRSHQSLRKVIDRHCWFSKRMLQCDQALVSTWKIWKDSKLNLLPCKVVAKRGGKTISDTRCRRCHQQPETLAHLMNACTPSVGSGTTPSWNVWWGLCQLMRQRGSTWSRHGQWPTLKPDLVVIDERTNAVVIVRILWRQGRLFHESLSGEMQKYSQLVATSRPLTNLSTNTLLWWGHWAHGTKNGQFL